MATEPTAPAAKPRGPKKLVILIVCAVCTAAGAAVPWIVNGSALFHHGDDKKKPAKVDHDAKTVAIPFGDVVVNLHEERMTRYLRVKIVLGVDAKHEKEATEQVNKHKPQLKNWLIGHLAGKSMKEVGGSFGVKRLQREILEHFEDVLYPDGDGPLREVMFEEYVVQ